MRNAFLVFDKLSNATSNFFRSFKRGTFGQLEIYHKYALVLVGKKAGLADFQKSANEDYYQNENCADYADVAAGKFGNAQIFVSGLVQSF